MRIIFLVTTILIISEFTFGQSGSPYPLVTLQQINPYGDTATAFWPSPLAGDTVRVRGEVIVQPLIDPITNRTPILSPYGNLQAYIEADDGSPWSGLCIYQSDSNATGTFFDLCDTAATYEFTGLVSQYGAAIELNLITTPIPIPVILISQETKRPAPIPLKIDSCFDSFGKFNLQLRKYNGMYVEFVSDNNHPLIVTYPPGLIYKPFSLADNKGRYLNFYPQSIFFRSNLFYTPPPEGSNLSYIRGLLEAYQPSSGWIWEIIPLYPGDIGPVGPLPVELISFNASAENGVVNLVWKTATETNNNGFEIERKPVDDNEWTALSFVKGSGNSLTPKQYIYTDKNINYGKYNYRLKQIDENGTYKFSDVITMDISGPLTFSLKQNYPNPFNPITVISYSLHQSSNVKIIVINTLGQTVKVLEDEFKNAGNYSVNFNASELPSGIYFYKLEAEQFSQVKKMMLVK